MGKEPSEYLQAQAQGLDGEACQGAFASLTQYYGHTGFMNSAVQEPVVRFADKSILRSICIYCVGEK